MPIVRRRSRHVAGDDVLVGVAHPGGLGLDEHLARAGRSISTSSIFHSARHPRAPQLASSRRWTLGLPRELSGGRVRRRRRRRRAQRAGRGGDARARRSARSSCSRRPTVGGGTRSEELTLPGFVHDVCSAIHPLGVASPAFARARARRARARMDPSRRAARASARRRARRGPRTLRRRDRGRLRRRRRRVPPPVRPVRRRRRHADRRAAVAARRPAPPSRSCSPATALVGIRSRDERRRAVRDRRGARRCSAAGRPLDALARRARHRRLRAVPRRARPPRRLADGQGRLGHDRGRARDDRRRARRRRSCATTASPRCATSRRPGPRCSTSRRARCWRSTTAGSRPLPPPLERFRYGPGVFKVDWALDGPIPWTNPRPPARRPCTSAAPRPRSPSRRRPCSAAAIPTGRSCCSRSRRSFDPTRAPDGQAHRLGVLPRADTARPST